MKKIIGKYCSNCGETKIYSKNSSESIEEDHENLQDCINFLNEQLAASYSRIDYLEGLVEGAKLT